MHRKIRFKDRALSFILTLSLVAAGGFPHMSFADHYEDGKVYISMEKTVEVDEIGSGYMTALDMNHMKYLQNGEIMGNAYGDFMGFMIKLNSAGEELWHENGTGGGFSGEYLVDMLPTDDGGAIIISEYAPTLPEGLRNSNIRITKIDSLGKEVKTTYIGGPSSQYDPITDNPSDIVKTSDGGYLITGYSDSINFGGDSFYPQNQGLYDMWLLKLDSNLDRVWLKSWGGADDEKAWRIVPASDGGYIVVGEASGADSPRGDIGGTLRRYDLVILKYDENGNLLFEKKYGHSIENDSASENMIRPKEIIKKDDGGYVIVSEIDIYGKYMVGPESDAAGGDISSYNGGKDIWVLEIDSSGNKVAQASIGGTGDDVAKVAVKSHDGGYLIGFDSGTGSSYADNGFHLIRLDESLSKTWSWNYGDNANDEIRNLQYIADGEYFINAKVSGLSKVMKIYPSRWSYLKDLKVGGTTLSGFSYDKTVYDVELPVGTTSFPNIETVSYDPNLIVSVENGPQLPGTSTIRLDSTLGDNIRNYTINFTVKKNNNAYLSSVDIGGSLVDGFAKGKFEYDIELPIGTKTVPDIGVQMEDENASHIIKNASSLPGTTSIEVTAEDGVTKNTYNINLTVKKSSNADLSNLKSGGSALEGFSSSVTEYTIELPYNESKVPLISAYTDYPDAVYEVVYAQSLPGTTIIDVTAEDNATTKSYKINYVLGKSNDAYLSDIRIDGQTVTGFVYGKYNYDMELEYGRTDLPLIEVSLKDSRSTYDIQNPASLPGTANISVNAEDGKTSRSYTVSYTIAKNDDATLSSIKLDGKAIEGFSPDIREYEVTLDYGVDLVPKASAVTNDMNAGAEIINATSIPGTTLINTTAEDNTTKDAYRINFKSGQSDNSYLSQISVDSNPIGGFEKTKTYYKIELPYGTTTVPRVKAVAENKDARVNVKSAMSLPGITVIDVDSQSGKTQNSYQVEFAIMEKQEESGGEESGNDNTDNTEDNGGSSGGSSGSSSGSTSKVQAKSELQLYNEELGQMSDSSSKTLTPESVVELSKEINQAIERSQDSSEVIEYTIKNMDEIGEILRETEKVEIRESAVDIVEKAVEKISRMEIDPEKLQRDGDKAKIVISSDDIETHISLVREDIEKISQKASQAVGEEWANEAKKSIRLMIPNEDAGIKELTADFDSKVMETISKNNIDQIVFDLDIAGFAVTSDTFANLSDDSLISLNASFADKSGVKIPKDVKQIEGMPVFEVNANIDSKSVKSFNEPMEVYFNISNLDTSKMTQDEIDSLTVFILDEEKQEWLPVGGKYDPVTKRMNVYRIHLSSYTVMKSDKSFSDIKDDESKQEIDILLKKGIIDDTASFSPQKEVTREEFVSWMSKAFGIEEKEINLTFKDMQKTDPYYKEVAGAFKQDLVSGRNELAFDPKANITRQEAAAIISKAMDKYEKVRPPEDTAKYLGKLEDEEDIASWAKGAVASMERKEIGSKNQAAYNPNLPMTKEDAAKMIYDVYESL